MRPLTADELPDAWALGRLAFGGPDEPPPSALREVDGVVRFGAFDDAGREPDLALDVRGFAVLYCGVGSGRSAAQAGLVGGTGDPAALDLVASGPTAQLLDCS